MSDAAGGHGYRERLRPPLSWWVVGGTLVLLLGVSVAVPLGAAAGAAVLVAGGAGVGLLLRVTATEVAVVDGDLVAGPARIPVRLLGTVEVLDAEAARAVRGPRSDPAAFHLIRAWVPAGVRVEVEDPQDPTPYWFVATRHPAELAAAVARARTAPTAG